MGVCHANYEFPWKVVSYHVLTHCGEKQGSFILICYVILSIQLILNLEEHNDCIPNHFVLLRN